MATPYLITIWLGEHFCSYYTVIQAYQQKEFDDSIKMSLCSLSLYVQIVLLLHLSPINFSSNMDKLYFTVVKTKYTTRDSPENPNLSSTGYFQSHFLMYQPEPS